MIPSDLKLKIVKKTHQAVFQNIKFFKNRSSEFTSLVVTELKPLNLMDGELIFSQGDDASDMYFINSGKVRLLCDLSDLIIS